MADQNKNDNTTSQAVPPFSSVRRSTKSKVKEALDNAEHLRETFFVNAHKQVKTYRDAFAKEGHNIIENIKAMNKSRRQK